MPDKVYWFSNGYVSFMLRHFAKWRIEGLENVPKEGPLLIVANHLSNLDPPLLSCSLPRRLYFLSKRGIFKPGIAQFLRAYGAYPVDRDGQDLDGFNWCRRTLAAGGAICMFPEARRAPEAAMIKALPGTALLALRTRAAILPIGITGTQHIKPLPRVFFPTGDILVRVGKPFTLPDTARVRREQLDGLTTFMMERVAELLSPRYRGVYGKPGETPPASNPQAHAGGVQPPE
ncbi:MAG: 1-acyl-sn-glycerol-3-phosphate acyltransferase [Dehalococcoidia bacterium]|nr:1-acyl-sn-glycerol-3-phosphate acyltransferase [Dehalococcoidia bacterium]